MEWSGRAPAPPAREAGKGTKDEEHAMSAKFNSEIAVIDIDIGKNSFHVVGLDRRGAIVLRQKWSRGQVEARFSNLPPCLIGMEACVGAHHLSRKLRALGHDARLMPAKYVPSLQIALATYPKRLARIHTSLRTSACYICRMNDSVRR